MERVILTQANASEELSSKSHEWNTTESLGDESHSGNLGSMQVAATEKMPVVGTSRYLFLELISDDHHLNVSIQVELDARLGRRQLSDGRTSVFNTTLSDQPPRRLRCQQCSQYNRDWPDPLQCKWNPVTPLASVLHQTGEHARGEQPANHLYQRSVYRPYHFQRERALPNTCLPKKSCTLVGVWGRGPQHMRWPEFGTLPKAGVIS